MKIIDLLEDASTALQRKLKDAEDDAKRIKIKATGAGGTIAPQYKTQYDRAKSAIAVIKDEIARHKAAAGIEDDQRSAAKKLADAKGKETPEEKKARVGKNVGEGLDNTNKLRDTFGGWEGLAKEVHKIYTTGTNEGTNEGTTKVSAEYIASKIGTTNRTVNKWLERSEFTKTARLMGRR